MGARTLARLHSIDGPFVTVYPQATIDTLSAARGSHDGANTLFAAHGHVHPAILLPQAPRPRRAAVAGAARGDSRWAALGTGADVRLICGGTEQASTSGVGALLRYAN